MKYLIFGLGNPGPEYQETRHNIGFKILDALAGASSVVFAPGRYADVAEVKHKGRTLILLKPMTFMNLSGKAVNYWMQKEKVPIENILVVTDDLALPFGSLRLRQKGSDGGHNGMKSIQEMLGNQSFPRLRFGIGNGFGKGQQVNYVLGPWSAFELETLQERILLATECIKAFATAGIARAMSDYNNR